MYQNTLHVENFRTVLPLSPNLRSSRQVCLADRIQFLRHDKLGPKESRDCRSRLLRIPIGRYLVGPPNCSILESAAGKTTLENNNLLLTIINDLRIQTAIDCRPRSSLPKTDSISCQKRQHLRVGAEYNRSCRTIFQSRLSQY